MHITRINAAPIINSAGEKVYSLIGADETEGSATRHSLAYVVIPPGCSSRPHYHPIAEETYYILQGRARLVINDIEYLLTPGDAVLITPPERHQIFTEGDEELHFIVACAPPWEPTNSVYLDEENHAQE